MKALILVTALALSFSALAQNNPATRTLKVFCGESEFLPDSTSVKYVQIESDDSKAANWLTIKTQPDMTSTATRVDLHQLVQMEQGTIESGRVIHVINNVKDENQMIYLKINYNGKSLKRLPSVLVTVENGKHVAIPMLCSHLGVN